MNNQLKIETFKGSNIKKYVKDLAELRISVFRDYPYLYDGSFHYEEKYLETYLNSPLSAFVLVFDQHKIVGASTCIPLKEEEATFQQPFIAAGFKVNEIMYFGESVLLPAYRGQGIGVKFFKEREYYALSFPEIKFASFCAVERPLNHPLKPLDYQGLDLFWDHRGYQKQEHLHTYLSWKDIDKNEETNKKMIFWIRKLK